LSGSKIIVSRVDIWVRPSVAMTGDGGGERKTHRWLPKGSRGYGRYSEINMNDGREARSCWMDVVGNKLRTQVAKATIANDDVMNGKQIRKYGLLTI
jgi:hypothetical protein